MCVPIRMAKNRSASRKSRKSGRVNTRKNNRNSRKNRMVYRKRHGGAAVAYNPAGVDYKLEPMSLKQGVGMQELNKQFHGGAFTPLGGVAYGEALAGKDGLPADMLAAARVEKLEGAMSEIKGMKDQAGGRRRGRKASRKGRKASRKGRKASRKGRKASRQSRKASRKGRKGRKVYRSTRRMRGGATSFADSAAEFTKDGDMSLGIDPRAAGLNQEWADVAAAKGGDYLGPKTLETYRSDMPN